MSEISHSDELVTKQDLSNFYQGILPYLGGMPEMLANKFSKSDLYSTDEKMIGQWIDGKPLYQKTFTGNSPNADFSQLEFATVPSDAELFWITDAFLFASGSACVSANGMAYSAEVTKATVVFRCWISAVHKKIMMTVGAEAYRNKPCYVTVLYTKTTDSAVNIGSEGDYSTTEKIVGTWIDGRPLYQKTVIVNSPASAGVDTIVASFDANVQPREMVGLLDNTIPLNYNGASDWYVKTRIEPSFSNSVVTAINIRMIVAGYTNRVTRITIRYTKA